MPADVKKKLEEELKVLETELKIELPRELQKAAALGDLRENAEYKAARDRQEYLQARVGALRKRLSELALINIDALPKDRAAYGSTLTLLDQDKDEEVTYRLVTAEESDLTKGYISTTSPIGKSLMGKREGDEIEVKTPQGVRHFEVLKLRTIHDE
ncbi:MAG: transcription elongation factor GreA [Blastocatellia bacterium]|nr:transcription elongation factor GreA [Blastocatellia bacterium]MBL8193764.1 transcription elongation factor GreA [Blastocatellia bacterium]MBN8722647.1 transcription elongation factor GreA [Acidobacteriota bacterium]